MNKSIIDIYNMKFSNKGTLDLLRSTLNVKYNSILDVGFGMGGSSIFFALNQKEVTSIGLEINSYSFPRITMENLNITMLETDLENLDNSKKFDAIWMSHVLEHTQNVGHFLQKANELLSDDGWLFIMVPPYKNSVVGGHITNGWNMGQLMYNLLLSGYDIKNGHFIHYDYNITAFVRKSKQKLPKLRMDNGDIERTKDFWPIDVFQEFDGDIKNINWFKNFNSIDALSSNSLINTKNNVINKLAQKIVSKNNVIFDKLKDNKNQIKYFLEIYTLIYNKVKYEDLIKKCKIINKKRINNSNYPDWYLNPNYDKLVASNKKIFIYLPWLHTNTLTNLINQSDDYILFSINIFKNTDKGSRFKITNFIRENPDVYIEMLLEHLFIIKEKIRGIILTFDWHPVTRILSLLCEDLSIERFLIPHESIFLDKSKYYSNILSGIKMPLGENLLLWGDLQKDIFIDRGVNENSIHLVGTPKFDKYYKYTPEISKDNFFSKYNLDSDKKCLLFVLQPLDSQIDLKFGRQKQMEAVEDILNYATNKIQVIFRMPPTEDEILSDEIISKITELSYATLDKANCYKSSPSDSIFYSDIIVSINSTMLFEGMLLNKPVLSVKYFSFKQLWDSVGIYAAVNNEQLTKYLDKILDIEYSVSNDGWNWAKKNLSCGEFDGKSTHRIISYLEESTKKDKVLLTTVDKLLITKDRIDLISIAPNLDGKYKYLKELLNCNKLYEPKNITELSWSEIYVKTRVSDKHISPDIKQSLLLTSKTEFIIDDGFIFLDDVLLSIVLSGDVTFLFDNSNSHISQELNNPNFSLTKETYLSTSKSIEKYKCYLEYISMEVENLDSELKILFIDEFSNKTLLNKTVEDLIKIDKKTTIYIYTLQIMDEFYYKTLFAKENLNIVMLSNKKELIFTLPWIDEIYSYSSIYGFMGLLYNKKVYCYGKSFYSNCGLTIDKNKHNDRNNLGIYEIFYVIFIKYSRYYNLKKLCTLDNLIDSIISGDVYLNDK